MKRKIISLFLILTIILSFVGCASSKSESFDNIEMPNGNAAIEYGGMFDNGSNSTSDVMKPEVAPSQDNATSTPGFLATQKLIYSCRLDVETLEFDNTTASVKQLIQQYGGFIESDELQDESWDWYTSDYYKDSATLREVLKIRIPTEKYSQFLGEVNGLGKIRNKEEQVTNITQSYNDTKTTIEMYEKEERMLLDMMDKAVSISDMLVVEERLAEVQRKLAIYKSNMNNMETDLAFSTITMTIKEVVEYTRNNEEISFGERFVKAIKDSLSGFVDFLEEFSILIVHIAPYLISVLIIVALIIVIRKRRKKKTRLATMESTAQNNPINNEQIKSEK